ncbi:MAG: GNAT family N-acetyltransferase [Chloroflexia bacterium]|nr:GNAT family N-acetyltransferase [Chloroflexia bacterium]
MTDAAPASPRPRRRRVGASAARPVDERRAWRGSIGQPPTAPNDPTAAPPRIRPYAAADWPAVWAIFREVVAAGETYAYDPNWSAAEARAVWVERPPGATVVACLDGRVVGTAKMGPNRPGPGSHVATASFMVAGAARGRGVGRALGEHALAWARGQGYAAMQFNAVVETNHAAVRLWRALGFRIVGTVPEAFQHPTRGHVGLHVMHRFL